jgi:hypothetical protein
MNVIKQAWGKHGCGLFIYLAFAVMVIGAAYEFFFKDDGGRGKRIKAFRDECHERGIQRDRRAGFSSPDYEAIVAKCERELRDYLGLK